jgi:hypothetical protein
MRDAARGVNNKQMRNFLFIYAIISIFIMIVTISIVILLKKKMYYTYIDKKDKPLVPFDYFQPYDGSWFFKNIDYEIMLSENPTHKEYINSKIKEIAFCKKVTIIIFTTLMVVGVLSKIFDIS